MIGAIVSNTAKPAVVKGKGYIAKLSKGVGRNAGSVSALPTGREIAYVGICGGMASEVGVGVEEIDVAAQATKNRCFQSYHCQRYHQKWYK